LAIEVPSDESGEQWVWSLFDEREPLERQMTEVVRRRIFESHGVLLPEAGEAAA
jgi:hypothetical protein